MAETETKAEEKYEAPSLSDALAVANGREIEPAPPVEPVTEAVTEAPKPEAVAEAPKPEPAAGATQVAADPEAKAKGVLGALQSERQKRQAAEAERDSLRAQMTQSQAVLSQPPEISHEGGMVEAAAVLQRATMLNLNASERLARMNHTDFGEKFAAFEKVAGQDKALFERVMTSDDPGEAAYREGSKLLMQEKYGADVLADPVKFREAVLKEAEAELAKPKPVATGGVANPKQPTDISGVRASGGAPAEWKEPSLDDHLRKAVKQRRG